MKALAISFAVLMAFGASAYAGGQPASDDVTGTIAADAFDSVPVVDFARSCAGAFSSREAAGACMSREEAALAQLQKQWAALPPRVRKLCVARVPQGAARAYSALADCAVKEGRLEKFRMMQSAR